MKTNYDSLIADIAKVANECREIMASMPVSLRTYRQCAGLPRVYPKLWMAMPHSNSLRFEMKEMQSLPNNGLKQWKE